jgi:hypothetical protein
VTSPSGFFFPREATILRESQHVLIDEPSGHYPNRIEIEPYVDPGEPRRFHVDFSPALCRPAGQPCGGYATRIASASAIFESTHACRRGGASYTVNFDIKGGHREQSP